MATEIVIQETVFNIDTGTSTSTVELTLSNNQGPQGVAGRGVPANGTTGKVLAKKTDADYDTEWITVSGTGGGSGTVTQVNTGTGLTGGPITTTGTISVADLSPAPTGAYGSATTVPAITVNAKGQTTAITPTAIQLASTTAVTGLDTALSNKAPSTGISPSAITGTAVVTADSRLSDNRIPTDASVTDAKIATTLSPSKITGTAVITSDSRLSDARTPTAHATSHAAAGSDPVTITPAQVTGTAVITTDSRLSDTRTPTNATVTDAKISTTLSASKITGVAITKADTATVTGKIQTVPSVNFSQSGANGIDTFPRHAVTSNGIQTAGGNISITTFQASDSFTMASVIANCTNTPNFGTGTIEFYLFAYDGVSTYTPKGKSATYSSSTPIVTGFNSIPITAFSGANLNLVAGSYYAIGRALTTGFTLAPIFMSAGITSLPVAGSTQLSIFCGPMLSATAAQALITTTTPLTYTVAQANPVWYRVLP